MNSKIINPSQYKKITKEKREKRLIATEKKIKKGTVTESPTFQYNRNYEKQYKTKKNRIVSAVLCISVMVVLSISSSIIFEFENSPVINVFSNNNENKINQDFELKIGVRDLDFNKNIILNEINKINSTSILKYDKNYNITLVLADNITKKDNLTYEIKFKDKDINQLVKEYIEKYILNNKQNIYYSKLNNIKSMEIKDKYSLIFNLNTKNEYFIYSLDFPIENMDKEEKYEVSYLENNSISFVSKNKSENILEKVSLINYTDRLSIIDSFKNKNIDMFFTTDEDDMKQLSRIDYNVKQYRDGETYFLFGNKDSKLFSDIAVRKAINSLLDKNKISKNISTSFAESIDLPYIYITEKYKYDTYAAENILLANSWQKKSGIYTKKDDKGKVQELKLKLVASNEDKIRVTIAENIKEMLENNGVKVELVLVKQSQITEIIKKKDYDLIIGKVYLGSTPDISYLYEYININENVNIAINKIKEAKELVDITSAINNLIDVMAEEVACIGIVAKTTNVITQKEILGIQDISYMNIFNEMEKVGK